MNKEFTSGYAPVNGLDIHYQIHSAADERKTPLVLLRGGGDTIQTSFRYLLPAVARDRQIIAFEQQGCGRTADIAEQPFSFEQSADDAIALLEHLRIDRADLLGFSNGGTSAAPTLVVGSDRDVMRPEGAVELFRLLPHAQLAILPRTEHMEITTRTSWLVPMINEFLDAEMPKTM